MLKVASQLNSSSKKRHLNPFQKILFGVTLPMYKNVQGLKSNPYRFIKMNNQKKAN